MEDLRQTSSQLNHAVQGLNELMEEALRIAGQAAHNGRPHEIAAIFDNATAHLRHATVTQKQPRRRQHQSADALHYGRDDLLASHMPVGPPEVHLPISRRVQPVRRSARRRLNVPVEQYHLGLPAAVSRAHLPNVHTSQPMRRHAKPRLDDPAELHYRSFPIRSQQYLRDSRRPERVLTKDARITDRPPPIAPVVQPVPPTRATPSPLSESSSTSHGSSNATTIGPDDLDLKHPRKRHISLAANQDISLGRHHHRQPIAREWPTYKKRITAVIACLNTVIIGLIVGIYVSLKDTSCCQNYNVDPCRRVKCREYSIRSKTRIIESSLGMFCK